MTAEWALNAEVCDSPNLFINSLKKIFDHSTPGHEAARVLKRLEQGRSSVADYSVVFRTLAIDNGWNEPVLAHELPVSLETKGINRRNLFRVSPAHHFFCAVGAPSASHSTDQTDPPLIASQQVKKRRQRLVRGSLLLTCRPAGCPCDSLTE